MSKLFASALLEMVSVYAKILGLLYSGLNLDKP